MHLGHEGHGVVATSCSITLFNKAVKNPAIADGVFVSIELFRIVQRNRIVAEELIELNINHIIS